MGDSEIPTRRASSRRRRHPSTSPDSDRDDDRGSSRRSREKSRSSRGRDRRRDDDRSSRKKRRRRRRRRERRDDEEEVERKRRKRRREKKRPRRDHSSSSPSSSWESQSSPSGADEESSGSEEPEELLRGILRRFPVVAADLKQILQMLDGGQAVDIRGIRDKKLSKLLKEFFCSLNVNQEGGLFLLHAKATPTLEVVGRYLDMVLMSADVAHSGPEDKQQSSEKELVVDEGGSTIGPSTKPKGNSESSVPQRRRLIGPEMPSSELLAAAAELTNAQSALRDAENSETDAVNDLFIGPPPPAVVAEAASANEAERFEEVERIMGAEVGRPYDVLSVNHKMPFENIKKRYWKLSLMVHPDKCSHPQAHQAFVLLNQAFKELQDPEKRKVIDEKIKLKEEEEAFKIELKALREAAQWRRLQGISLEGDEELLAEPKGPKEAQKRDEWMTQLPPERKPGMAMHSTFFSRSGKEGRGDTSVWTDSPLEKTEKAKQNFLEAYNKTAALAAADEDRKQGSDADLVDMFNRSKRSVSLVHKHQEEIKREKKKKHKQRQQEQEGWVGQHPWKPWDREKDLVAGRQKVNFDAENMAQGLASRFSSGAVQRNFL